MIPIWPAHVALPGYTPEFGVGAGPVEALEHLRITAARILAITVKAMDKEQIFRVTEGIRIIRRFAGRGRVTTAEPVWCRGYVPAYPLHQTGSAVIPFEQ